jgi:DNA-directed RNA polymerase subunit N (RpoN/RPB10)
MAQVPIAQKYCTCTDKFYNPTEIGKRQKEYEELRLKGENRFDALNAMGLINLCCRESIFNPPMIFLNDENVGRLRDETNILSTTINTGKLRRKNQETIKDTPDILPKVPLPELP